MIVILGGEPRPEKGFYACYYKPCHKPGTEEIKGPSAKFIADFLNGHVNMDSKSYLCTYGCLLCSYSYRGFSFFCRLWLKQRIKTALCPITNN